MNRIMLTFNVILVYVLRLDSTFTALNSIIRIYYTFVYSFDSDCTLIASSPI